MGLGDWDAFVEDLAEELAPALRRRLYDAHLRRLRRLRSTGEKLVYLFLVVAQPQTFTSIRRALSLSRDTVDRALRRLLEAGFVYQDERYLYWVSLLEELV